MHETHKTNIYASNTRQSNKNTTSQRSELHDGSARTARAHTRSHVHERTSAASYDAHVSSVPRTKRTSRSTESAPGLKRNTQTSRNAASTSIHAVHTNKQSRVSQDDQNVSRPYSARKRSDKPTSAHHLNRVKRTTRDPHATLKVIPLGGLDAIGKNMTVLECGNDLVVDDCGLMFPDDDHPGVDLILPDYSYVIENADRLRGVVITHGHEDHTGSLPYLFKDLPHPVPIYGTRMTLGLIEGKFKEHGIKGVPLIEIKAGQTIQLGCIQAEFWAVNHSIPGAVGIFFTTPAGNVLHTGDFKLDQTPIDGVHTDFAALARFQKIGVDLMLSDSTNATHAQFTPSELEVGKALEPIIAHAKGKVIVASFASHIHRLQQVCDAALRAGRKVVVTGRSMIQNTEIARKLGYLNVPDDCLLDAFSINNIPPEKLVVLCTGSQGEPLSALARMAGGSHKTVGIEAGDTVIISATPVPGNEKAVTRIINLLAKIGADVYDKSRALVHVSGHAGAEELKIILSIVRPIHFMPVHGEAMHLRAHARLAQATGVKEENIFILENGESLELHNGSVDIGEKVKSGVIYVEGSRISDTSDYVLRDRTSLGSQGVVSISCAVSYTTSSIIGAPVVVFRGVSQQENQQLTDAIKANVQDIIRKQLANGKRNGTLEREVRNATSFLLQESIKQRPLIIVTILAVA